jgi:D-beta-D-heptose 7-phosphate kinase / D-beta-D-heptose 1-phosphate adenosyltransferase
MLTTLPDFSKARVLVVGDVMLDRYWSGKAARISPEAPVPVVQVKEIEDRLGGAANVALNIAKLGGQVTLLGVVGADAEGGIIKYLLEQAGVACDLLIEESMPSIRKLRILAQHQQLIRIDFEETPIVFNQGMMLDKLTRLLPANHAVVFSDYGKGTLATVQDYIQLANRHNVQVLVDPKDPDYTRYSGANLITPNLSEFQQVAGASRDENEILANGRDLLQRFGIETLLLTRGEAGMTLIQQELSHSLPAQAKDVYDVTGAGDTVIAVMALGIALAMPLPEVMYLANLAGGIVVGKLGTSTVTALELSRAMHSDRSSTFGVVSEDELASLINGAKANGEKIVMTNGCFDLLHVGHITYLEQAKALGDRLIVAVNSDESVKQLKGDSRPINGLQERMAVLAALACVDWVVPFTEETPERLYCRLLPDILVKGGDYTPDQVAGGDCVTKAGGKVKILGFVEGHSTTSIINKAGSKE